MIIPNTVLPDFSEARIQGLEKEVLDKVTESRAAVSALLASRCNVDDANFIMELDRIYSELHEISGVPSHLNAVVSSDFLREVLRKCLPALSEFSTDMGQSLDLYQALDAIRQRNYSGLTVAQRRFVETELRDFALSGVHLPDDQKQRVKAINLELSEKLRIFGNHLLDATQGWSKHVTDVSELDGLPQGTLGTFAAAAEKQGLNGFLVKIDMPSYTALMQQCTNRAMRAECHRAYATRCSSESPQAPAFGNEALVAEILALRHERALLLGLKNHAEWSLVPKMAKSTSEVVGFLRDLGNAYKPLADAEFAGMCDFARLRHGWSEVHAWDIAYLSEEMRKETCSVSDEEIRPYFPAEKVLSGFFEVAKKLFGISFEQAPEAPVWHRDVRFYRVMRGSEIIAGCYFDLYARPDKRGGAWMDNPILRRAVRPHATAPVMHQTATGPVFFETLPNRLQLPVAYLCCNFTPPTNDGLPSLLSHDEVSTLFHEGGHGLHHLLTEVNLGSKCGVAVEWDGVELPSQLMQNWIWTAETMPIISGHFQTGEPLPQVLLDNLIRARNFHVGLHKTRQVSFALFDFLLHMDYDPAAIPNVMDIANKVRDEALAIPYTSYDRYPFSFSHIFGGGYDAGYYSYLWAEVLSCAVYETVTANAIFDLFEGERYVDAILSRGGEEEMAVMVKDYLGAEPTIDSLLRSDGVISVERR